MTDDNSAQRLEAGKMLKPRAFSHVFPNGKTDAVVRLAVAQNILAEALATRPTSAAMGSVPAYPEFPVRDACETCGRTKAAHEKLGWDCNDFQPCSHPAKPAQSEEVGRMREMAAQAAWTEASYEWVGTEDQQHEERMKACLSRRKTCPDDECDEDGSCTECKYDMHEALETDASKIRRATATRIFEAIRALDIPDAARSQALEEAESAEAIAQFLHDEGGFDEAWTDSTWPEHPGDTGQRDGGFVKIVPSDVQAKFRDVARHLLIGRSLTPIALMSAPKADAGEGS